MVLRVHLGAGSSLCASPDPDCALGTKAKTMKLIDVTQQFQSDNDCLDYIEKMRWPDGQIGCVHCGEVGRVSKITREAKGKNKRTRLFQCLACGKQFSSTSGTIFNDT